MCMCIMSVFIPLSLCAFNISRPKTVVRFQSCLFAGIYVEEYYKRANLRYCYFCLLRDFYSQDFVRLFFDFARKRFIWQFLGHFFRIRCLFYVKKYVRIEFRDQNCQFFWMKKMRAKYTCGICILLFLRTVFFSLQPLLYFCYFLFLLHSILNANFSGAAVTAAACRIRTHIHIQTTIANL